MTLIRLTSHTLKFVAIVQMLTFAVVFMPLSWIEAWHHWLGMGVMPDDPVLRYVIRGASYVQGAVGVLVWVMATDVIRYRPLIITVALINLISAPAFYLIDAIAGMPRFWCIFDFAYCFLVGGVLLALCLLSGDCNNSSHVSNT